ncbi:hypothetical protein AN958_10372 [Leucoagaricus sp. SymC.cos]|nr:hypothetical protein AN958_10372 [Leucoagaricus sp. SymC.cos]
MRLSVAVTVAALASAASANVVSRQDGLPACAMQCLSTADLDGCVSTDNACLCKSTKFVESSTVCIGNTCKGSDLQAALQAAQQLCAIVVRFYPPLCGFQLQC